MLWMTATAPLLECRATFKLRGVRSRRALTPQVHAPVPHGEPGPAVKRLRIKPAQYQHDPAATTVIARKIRIERG
jgi:hypothetical protein